MSKLSQELAIEDGMYDADIEDEDYAFILGPNGELKSIFLPEAVPFKTPKKIARILKVFGISDISQVNGDVTLH